jgi:hypothetical protein
MEEDIELLARSAGASGVKKPMNDVEWLEYKKEMQQMSSKWREVATQFAELLNLYGKRDKEIEFYMERRAWDNFNRLNEKYPQDQ